MKHNAKLMLMVWLVLGQGLAACGTVVGNPEEDDDVTNPPPAGLIADLPEMRGISLANLGTTPGTNLTHQEDCSGTENLGVFGFVYAPACILSIITSSALYGTNPDKNNDDLLTCDEYDPNAEDSGMLFALLCEEGLTNLAEVTSLRFAENGDETAIDFRSDNGFGLGHWTARGEDSRRYPASIRIYGDQPNSDSLFGAMAMRLESGNKGTVYYSLNEEDDFLLGDSTVDVKAEKHLSACETAPSRESCHFAEYNYQGQDGDLEGSVGIRMQVHANKREDADFIMIEGEYSYTEAQAAAQFTDDPNTSDSFQNIRYIYFRTVQKGGQIWGSFDFKDADNNTIATPLDFGNGNVVDLTGQLRNGPDDTEYAGVCINFGSDEWVDCVDVDYTDYTDLWQGDAAFSPSAEYTQPIDYSSPPQAGLCYRDNGDERCL